MDNYINKKLLFDGISFHLSNDSVIDEREIHLYHEILYLIEGEGYFSVEDTQVEFKNNMLFIIPKGKYHFCRPYKSKGFKRLKIGFSQKVINDIPVCNAIKKLYTLSKLNEPTVFLLNRLCQVLMEDSTRMQGFHAYSIFLLLLSELEVLVLNEGTNLETESSEFMSKIINYISENFSKEITIDTISRNTHISPSAITHYFKKELGLSVHQYITQRRLVYAQSLIASGEKPSKIFFKCGYKDYSAFYKAYVRFFGYPPSKEKQQNAHR